MSDREIKDTDNWEVGAIITKDGKTFYKVASKSKERNGYLYRLDRVVQNCEKEQ